MGELKKESIKFTLLKPGTLLFNMVMLTISQSKI